MNEIRIRKIEEVFQDYIRRAINVDLIFDEDVSGGIIELVYDLHTYSVHQVLHEDEVSFDPRKINYKATQELKLALVSIFLAFSLVEQYRNRYRTKEFFEDNISVHSDSEGGKVISFGDIPLEVINLSLYAEIVHDWKIYRDRTGFGILNLIDEKTNLQGLNNFTPGGDVAYEFARFHRKYIESKLKESSKLGLDVRKDFQKEMVKAIASEYAKQQISQGVNPLELIEDIFSAKSSESNNKKNKSHRIDDGVELEIIQLLEKK